MKPSDHRAILNRLKANPLVLNKADVVARARAAFEAEELQAQKHPLSVTCNYAGPCAIGAAIPDPAIREALDQAFTLGFSFTDIPGLINAGLVVTDDPGFLIRLQRAHDARDLETLEELIQ